MTTSTFDITAPLPAATDSSRKQILTGRILGGVAVLYLLFDAIGKVTQPKAVIEGTVQFGWPLHLIFPLGILQLVLLALYLIPRTAVFGAILWTGYLGGAVAAHVHHLDPLFSHVLFPAYVAAFLWLGLWFRDRRLRALVPFTN
jgi:hypothetical protein